MKRKHPKFVIWMRIILVSIFMFCILLFLEYQLLPPLKEISHIQCKSFANKIINEAIFRNMKTLNVSSLLIRYDDNYTADTATVNRFCTNLSMDITNDLKILPAETIRIPVGAATNLSYFSTKGPEIPFRLIPMGSVNVDYETAFSSAGINQVNYKIWIDICMELKIVNPLYQETIQMNRKIMLADLIYSGKVPEHYFQLTPKDEYLLTE